MTSTASAADQMKRDAQSAALQAGPTLVKLVRFGYVAKGTVYLIVGLLAGLAASGRGGETTGSRGALANILGQPFGRVLLVAVAVGLAVYGLWQFFRAAIDPEHRGAKGKKSVARRIGYAISGVIQFGLVVAAVRLLTAYAGSTSDNASAQDWTAALMRYPFGQLLVAAVGAGIAAFGLYQLYKAYRSELDKQLAFGRMSEGSIRLTLWVGRLGIAARGVVFAVVGGFLVSAAVQADPGEARGLGGALDAVHARPHGRWLLGLVAAGLAAYGVYLFIRARYRRVELT